MKITFIHCSNRAFSDTQMFGIHFMPVWAYTLAAHLQSIAGVELSLHDERFDSRDTLAQADLFLFTGINQDYDAILDTTTFLRDKFPSAIQLIGGPICWSFDTAGKIERLSNFDHIFIGDGEWAIQTIVADLIAGKPLPKIIRAPERFDLAQALPMHRPLMRATIARYYGAVVEVSRGCPFLCEFCDIRVLPDNNRSHVKNAELIVAELDELADLGVKQVLFACDNFIGNSQWAEDVCDRIIQWQERTGKRVSLYTWLTIDLSRHPRLLAKLRRAGFDMFFVGVESFNLSSLRETAKVQNTMGMVAAIRTIQSYGFIVVAGLIIGFDTDPANIIDIMMNGILESGLISGDPSLLTALPGTPLYRRMQLSGRLRDAKLGLGGFKYQTNIRYLRSAASLKEDFRSFVRRFNTGSYQLQRLLNFYACLESENYRPPQTSGYANLPRLLAMSVKNLRYVHLLALRFFKLFASPERIVCIMRAIALTYRASSSKKPLWFYFKFWLFNWSNALLKYSTLKDSDFDIESVPVDFNIKDILPQGYDEGPALDGRLGKERAQKKSTTEALQRFISSGGMP